MASTSAGELGASCSVIRLALLPFAAADAEEAHQRRGDQEWDHGHRDRGALTQLRARGSLAGTPAWPSDAWC